MPVVHSKTYLETFQHQIHYRSVPGRGKKREVQEQLLVDGQQHPLLDGVPVG